MDDDDDDQFADSDSDEDRGLPGGMNIMAAMRAGRIMDMAAQLGVDTRR